MDHQVILKIVILHTNVVTIQRNKFSEYQTHSEKSGKTLPDRLRFKKGAL